MGEYHDRPSILALGRRSQFGIFMGGYSGVEEESREWDIPKYVSHKDFDISSNPYEVKVASLGLAPRNLAYPWRYAVCGVGSQYGDLDGLVGSQG